MGIQGLLPKLKSIVEKKNIKEYSNKKVAIDAYVWLHRGVLSCCQELVQQIPTDKYLTYCVHMVKMLIFHKVTPVLVFGIISLSLKPGIFTLQL
jgi:exonuclease 1